MLDAQKTPIGPPENTRVILDRISLGWRVDDTEHLLQMVLDQPIVENRILLSHGRHESVLCQVVPLVAVLLVRARHLLVKRLYVGGQQALQVEVQPFLRREARAFIVERAVEEESA